MSLRRLLVLVGGLSVDSIWRTKARNRPLEGDAAEAEFARLFS